MRFVPLEIPEVILVESAVSEDERGFFLMKYQKEQFTAAGIHAEFVQDNQSTSKQGVLRGLHYQIRHPQGKLVSVIAGEVYDVAVDLRRNSPTFGRWLGMHLAAKDRNQIWIPAGFAHGFYTLSDWAEIHYKTTDYYAPDWERTLLWNDLTLGIEWPLLNDESPLLSKRDKAGIQFLQAEVYE